MSDLVHPFIFSILGLISSRLQTLQFQSKSWTTIFLEPRNYTFPRNSLTVGALFFDFLPLSSPGTTGAFSFTSFSSNTYLWCLKKIKSRWLWNVTVRLPLNWGSWGNIEASNLPTRCPSRVVKLFKRSSGICLVGFPWPLIFLLSLILESLKCAVGPSGKFTTSNPFGFFRFSFMMNC